MKVTTPPLSSIFSRSAHPQLAQRDTHASGPQDLAPAFGARQPSGAFRATLTLARPTHPSHGSPGRIRISDFGFRISDFLSVYSELFKARLNLLVLLTTLLGFYLGSRGPANYLLLLHTLLGTAFLAAGAAALNQLFERDLDAKMRRTRNRPLPSGHLQPRTVFSVGCAFAALGLGWLALEVNPTTTLLGASSLLLYLFVYTPLKRVTWLNTLAGAFPGALPPLIGWTAARGALEPAGLALFAIQALWQLPHFFAIAWIYRDEYAKAGFRMLSVLDPTGHRTAGWALTFTVALLGASLAPYLLKLAGVIYLFGALVLGGTFIWQALQFARSLTVARARQLFYLSLLYLPLLFTLLALDKVKP